MPDFTQTATPVHSEESLLDQRAAGEIRENNAVAASLLFAQLLSSGALYLLPVAATSAWIAALGLILPAAALYCAALLTAGRMRPEDMQTPAARILLGLAVPLFVSDMAICLLSLTETTVTFMLPGTSRVLLSLLAVAAAALGLHGRAKNGNKRLARFLRAFLIAGLLACVIIVLPEGNAGYLFPLMGYGARHTLRCALWACGGLWSAALPPFLSFGKEKAAPLFFRGPGALLMALCLFALTMLCCAWLLPAPALSGTWGFAIRLQTIIEMSPSTISWSLMLFMKTLLFMISLSCAARCARDCLCRALNRQRFPVLILLLVCVPLSVIGAGAAEHALIALLPWRYPYALCLLAAGFIAARVKRRKQA